MNMLPGPSRDAAVFTTESATAGHPRRPAWTRLTVGGLVALLSCAMMGLPAPAQVASTPDSGDTASERAHQVLAEPAADEAAQTGTSSDGSAATTASVNLLQLVWTARWLMLPIILMSILVVAVAVERFVSLRRRRVIPPGLVEQVWQSTEARATFSPRALQQATQEFPSPAATVVQSLLGKLGRPSGDMERAVSETMQRESERLYRPVRSLNLAAAVTPLLGLLGTVWGMIEAFFATANLPIGANKAESLAEGIYTALVTTAGGLVVAIPAAILAHYFEGQIQKVFHEIHELVYDRLIPKLEQVGDAAPLPRTLVPPTPKPPTPPPIVTRG